MTINSLEHFGNELIKALPELKAERDKIVDNLDLGNYDFSGIDGIGDSREVYAKLNFLCETIRYIENVLPKRNLFTTEGNRYGPIYRKD